MVMFHGNIIISVGAVPTNCTVEYYYLNLLLGYAEVNGALESLSAL